MANSDTMSGMNAYTSGGRTRNVVNVANPGGTGAAYSFTAADSAGPTADTDGYANFRQQKYLHVHVSGNIAAGGGARVRLWGYNNFAEAWGPIQHIAGVGTGSWGPAELTCSYADYRAYYTFDIAGTNRIAAECTDFGSNGTVYVYLGVNSF